MIKRNLFTLVLLFCAIALSLAVFTADEKDHAKALSRKYDDKECKLSKITTEELLKAIDNKKVSIVDVNGSKVYAKGHILGAHDFTAQGLEGRLPPNKSDLVVVYYSGEQCSDDKDACKKCSSSDDHRAKCSANKDDCDKCGSDKGIRDKCMASKISTESSKATKDAAEKLKALGYSNVKCFCAGLDGWIAAGGAVHKE